jgi:hypothetical protein
MRGLCQPSHTASIESNVKEPDMSRKTVLAAAFAASLMGLGATAAHAQIYVQVAPPAPQYEVVPAPRAGQVWAAGHYEWRGDRYLWVPGRWITARSGYEWRDARWVQRANGQWYMVGGTWERGPHGDRDHDGIANRYDRDRDGDGIPNRVERQARYGAYGDLDRDGVQNRYDRDRDGDGIANARDRHPDDRRRS